MLCLAVILAAQITLPLRTAHVTKAPKLQDSLVARLDKIFEKLERLTVPTSNPLLIDDEEELLSAIQAWGRLDEKQLNEVAKDVQRMREDADEERSDRLEMEYADMDDEEYADINYHNDGNDDDDEDLHQTNDKPAEALFIDEDTETSSVSPLRPGVTPLAFTRDEGFRTIVSAVGSIAATNERPRVLDDSGLTAVDRKALRTAAYANMGRALRASNCLVPQPRWLSVRQLAPSSDTMYMPPCVELHRCAPDSGCCKSEAEVCAPIEGRHVVIPFYLHKADGKNSVARMMFFNHTVCACVARDTLRSTVHIAPSVTRHVEERQNDWRPAPAPAPAPAPTQAPTMEPKIDEDVTAPPMMRRCTCPKYFLASTADESCTCACDWKEPSRRRECLYFSRGKEHLGLSDRVCIEHKDCALPTCDYGPYDRQVGKCPARKYRRLRYHVRRHEKNVV